MIGCSSGLSVQTSSLICEDTSRRFRVGTMLSVNVGFHFAKNSRTEFFYSLCWEHLRPPKMMREVASVLHLEIVAVALVVELLIVFDLFLCFLSSRCGFLISESCFSFLTETQVLFEQPLGL